MKMKKKKKRVLFIAGIIMTLIGVSVLAVFGWKRITREIEKQKLLKECVVFEIPQHLHIKLLKTLLSSRLKHGFSMISGTTE